VCLDRFLSTFWKYILPPSSEKKEHKAFCNENKSFHVSVIELGQRIILYVVTNVSNESLSQSLGQKTKDTSALMMEAVFVSEVSATTYKIQ
jgi:hypothetical protein